MGTVDNFSVSNRKRGEFILVTYLILKLKI
nr:MAG TPA: hypothetical protein [Bacteriophage sp.]